MLKREGPQEWIVSEIQRVNKMKFDFLEKKQSMGFCSGLAKSMHTQKVEELLIYHYYMEEFKPDLIKQYLDELTPDNLLTIVEAKSFETECTLTEPIYGTKYSVQQLPDIECGICNVTLPEKN